MAATFAFWRTIAPQPLGRQELQATALQNCNLSRVLLHIAPNNYIGMQVPCPYRVFMLLAYLQTDL